MKSYNKEFLKLLQKSKNILVITHKSQDMDAFCSLIMTKLFVNILDPKKNIKIVARQFPTISLPRMKDISIVQKLEPGTYDLIVVTDAGNIGLCIDETVDTLQNSNIPVICIDHHTEMTNDPNTLVINEKRSSATEQIFATFKDILGRRFKITKEIAELTQYGIVSDTGRFLYTITTPDTHRIFADAKEISPVDMEDTSYKMQKFPREANDAMVAYMESLTIEKDMAYMYITNEVINERNLAKTGVNEAQSFLRDRYIRFIQGVHWGFIIKPDFDHENTWFVSFRSTKGYQDVGIIAKALGGGGHEYASASPITAQSGEEALQKVLEAVKHTIQ